jgi:hypothetical protein
MASIIDLISAHPVLSSLASFISTVDLFNLALTCKSSYLPILSSPRAFQTFRRNCLCDGRGLAERQAFAGLYSLHNVFYFWGHKRHIWKDEPIEARLYATKCDAAAALPCRKCNINVCEECRYYPREPPHSTYPERRPHLNSPWQSENVMCLCPECDERCESELAGRFLSELCDCDIYARWICKKCVEEEQKFTSDYYKNHTKWEGEDDNTKTMHDHQFTRDVRMQPKIVYNLSANSH